MPRKRELDPRPIYYVYALFDWLGVPRWIGKGKNRRMYNHERSTDSSNWLKNEFIEQTWLVLEEIPKIKIQENIPEREAFTLETLMIASIGRLDQNKGPLLNLTNGGEGMSGQRQPTGVALALRNAAVSQGHRRRTKEEIAASSLLRKQNTPEGKLQETARKNAAARTPEERSRMAKAGGVAAGKLWWINDGQTNKRIKPNSVIPKNWIRGRIYTPASAFIKYAIKTVWINDGIKTKRMKQASKLPAGWTYGRRADQR